MPFTHPIRLAISRKVCFYIPESFLFQNWKFGLLFKKPFKRCFPVPHGLFYSFGTDVFDPLVLWVIWDKYIVQPFGKGICG